MAGEMEEMILNVLNDDPGEPGSSEEPKEPGESKEPEEPEEPGEPKEPEEPEEESEEPEEPEEPEKSEEEKEDKKDGEEEEPEGEFDEQLGKPQLVTAEDGAKQWILNADVGREIYDGYLSAKQYREVAATPEEAREHQAAFQFQEDLHAVFDSGDPSDLAKFLGYWNERSPKNLKVMAEQLVEGAQRSNKDAYEAMESYVLGRTIDQLYQDYATTNDKESAEAKQVLYGAQVLDFLQNGSYQLPDAIQVKDPADERVRELEAREARREAEKKAEASQARANWRDQTFVKIRTSLNAEIDTALEKLADVKKEDPFLYNSAVKELRDAVRVQLEQDKAWIKQFNRAFGEAIEDGSETARKAVIGRYLERARRVINPKRGAVIERVSKYVMRQADKKKKRRKSAKEASKTLTPAGRQSSSKQKIENPSYEEAKKGKNITGMVNALLD